MPRIIITGGTGFIGSHVVEELLKKKFEIFVVDIKEDPHSYFALSHLKKRCHLEILDIRKRRNIFTYFNKIQPKFVFHLAAEPIVATSYKSPVATFETNIMGTIHVLEAARNIPSIKCTIIASSDKAYGKTKKTYTESSPLHGDHPYDVSKSSADLIAQTYFKTYQTPSIITRFGNVYGEGDTHLDRIIPGICKAVITKQELKIRSDGTYIRDYLYVKDVALGYLTLLNNYQRILGEAFNFSSDTTLSVLDLVKKSETILHKTIPCTVLNTAKNEIPYQHLDDTKIQKLGWKRKYTFDQGFRRTYRWYKSNFFI